MALFETLMRTLFKKTVRPSAVWDICQPSDGVSFREPSA